MSKERELGFDIAVVGHLTIDSIFLPSRQTPFVVLGGSAAYVSFAARRLGARVSIISKVGGDFPDAYRWWLEQDGIDMSNVVKNGDFKTTRFEIKYNDNLSGRSLQSPSRAAPIEVGDVPSTFKAKVIHVAPVAGEIPQEVVKRLKIQADVLSMDPQGLVRSFGSDGSVVLSKLANSSVLALVDIFKSSIEEIEAVTGERELETAMKMVHDHGVKIVVVTMGPKGSAVLVEEEVHYVPAYVSEKIVDPTGAGDAFIGGFLAEYVRGEDCCWCSCVGSAVASLVVEGIGPTFFGENEEIYRRARSLYEKGIKG